MTRKQRASDKEIPVPMPPYDDFGDDKALDDWFGDIENGNFGESKAGLKTYGARRHKGSSFDWDYEDFDYCDENYFEKL